MEINIDIPDKDVKIEGVKTETGTVDTYSKKEIDDKDTATLDSAKEYSDEKLSDYQPKINADNKVNADFLESGETNKIPTFTEWGSKADNTIISTNSTDTDVTLALENNNEYRYTLELTSLAFTVPSGDFIAGIVFKSGATATQMTYDSSIKWTGDDVNSNAFVPAVNKDYNIFLWYDGININAVVRGV